MRVTRKVPSEVPTVLKKFMNAWNHATQEEHWTGNPSKGYNGAIKITHQRRTGHHYRQPLFARRSQWRREHEFVRDALNAAEAT